MRKSLRWRSVITSSIFYANIDFVSKSQCAAYFMHCIPCPHLDIYDIRSYMILTSHVARNHLGHKNNSTGWRVEIEKVKTKPCFQFQMCNVSRVTVLEKLRTIKGSMLSMYEGASQTVESLVY